VKTDILSYIMACTVVQAVVKTNRQSSGKGHISTQPWLQNPGTDFD